MSSSPLLLLSSAVLLLFLSSAAATDHIVGANKGWNPGLNYTLWANNHTFYVGDYICNESPTLSLSLSSSIIDYNCYTITES